MSHTAVTIQLTAAALKSIREGHEECVDLVAVTLAQQYKEALFTDFNVTVFLQDCGVTLG